MPTMLEQYEAMAVRLEQVARGYRLDLRRHEQTASQLDCLTLRADEADSAADTIRHLIRALRAACEFDKVVSPISGKIIPSVDAEHFLAETAEPEEAADDHES